MIKEYSRIEVAISNLDEAIRMYFKVKNDIEFFPVIILAGACEEVLGKIYERSRKDSVHKIMKKEYSKEVGKKEKEVNDEHTNRIKNWLKHADDQDKDKIKINVEVEVVQYILRGIGNYHLLFNNLKEEHKHFLKEIDKKFPKAFEGLNPIN